MARKPQIALFTRDVMGLLTEKRIDDIANIGEAIDLMWAEDPHAAAEILRQVQESIQKGLQVETLLQANGIPEVMKLLKDELKLIPPKSGK